MLSSNPTISVIIPCYNCELYVRKAVDSVLNQTYKNWNLILVNNNSTDGTQAILNEYQAKYPTKVWSLLETKKGSGPARNAGLKYATGEVIQFLDADDEILPDKLDRQVKLMIENQADIICSTYKFVKKKKGQVEDSVINPESGNVWKGLIGSKLGITSANLWRKEKLMSIGGWDEELSSSQEYDLLFRLLAADCKVTFDMVTSAVVYSVDNSISRTQDKNRLEKILNNLVGVRLRVKDYLISKGSYNNELNEYFNTFLFSHLMGKKLFAPEHVDKTIRQLNLHVPLNLWLSSNLKYNIKRQLMNFKIMKFK